MNPTAPHAGMALLYTLGGGPLALAWGLRKLNEKRLIENTPVSKVRSAALGLVELSGTAKMEKPQIAPMSTANVCWWKCRVEEYVSSGKDSHWRTVKEVTSNEVFFLEDATGRVYVNPFGAELHVEKETYLLDALTQARIAPVLMSWGIDGTTWLGLEKRMRVIEETIPEGWPLFVLGKLIAFHEDPNDRRARFLEYLRAVKADPAKMAEADTNHDGTVDAEEWAAFEAKKEEEFLAQEIAREAKQPNQIMQMITAPEKGPFVVSTKTERELLSSFKWLAPLALTGGLGLCGFGVWLALMDGCSPAFTLGSLGAGFLFSFMVKQINFNVGIRRGL